MGNYQAQQNHADIKQNADTTGSIIGLSETWLSNIILDSKILPHGYTIYRKDRESRGGGVTLAISNNFPSKQLPSPPNLEIVTVSIFLDPAFTCRMVYAPPNATVEYHTELTNYLATITSSPNPLLIIGDFNIPDINWFTLTGCSVISNKFCEFIFQSNLVQVVNTPTHKHGLTW